MSAYLLPVVILLVSAYCLMKRVKIYDCFLDGAKKSLSLVKTIFPYIATVFIAIELFKASGLSALLASALEIPLSRLGIPSEIAEILLLVPLSGNGTIALLEGIISDYGADSYVARCAAVIAGGTETIFYISAVYMSKTNVKHLKRAIPISLFCTLLGAVVGCALCRIM